MTGTGTPIRDEWLWGWDQTPGIVSVWAGTDGQATVWRRDPVSRALLREEAAFRVRGVGSPMTPARTLHDLRRVFRQHRQRVIVDDRAHIRFESRRIAEHQIVHGAG